MNYLERIQDILSYESAEEDIYSSCYKDCN